MKTYLRRVTVLDHYLVSVSATRFHDKVVHDTGNGTNPVPILV